MKKRILIPVDFSQGSLNAMEHGIFVANTVDAFVRIMHVRAEKKFAVPFVFKDIETQNVKSAKDFCEILVEKYQKSTKKEMDYKLREGKVYEEIVSQAKYSDISLIVMGTHGASGFEEFFIGSNAQKVVTNSPCPVMTIRHGFTRRELKKIILTIDETPESKMKVRFVTDIASKFNSTIHILGVRESDDPKIISAIEKNIKQVATYTEQKGLKHKIEHLSGKNLTNLGIDYASQIAADLIAIMENQPASIKNFWLGAHAQQMVNHSPIPVLTIRQIHSKSE